MVIDEAVELLDDKSHGWELSEFSIYKKYLNTCSYLLCQIKMSQNHRLEQSETSQI